MAPAAKTQKKRKASELDAENDENMDQNQKKKNHKETSGEFSNFKNDFI